MIKFFKQLDLIGLILFFLILAGHADGQKREFTQLYANLPAYNPGFTGIENFTEATLAYKQNWSNFDNSDGSFYISIFGSLGNKSSQTAQSNSLRISSPKAYDKLTTNKKLRRKHGVGGRLSSQSFGPLKQLNFDLNYAYHLPISDKFSLSLGTSVGLDVEEIDFSNLTVRNPVEDDFYNMLINSSEGKQQGINISFGATLYSNKFYLGISASPLVQTMITEDPNLENIKTDNRYTALIGNVFDMNNKLEIQPILKVSYSDLYDINSEVSLRARYNKLIYLGAAYKKDISASLLFGLTFDGKYNINYSYDYFLSNLNNFNNGVHEFTLGLALFNKYAVPSRIW